MYRRLALLLVLQLTLGASRRCLSAPATGSAANARADSVEAARSEQELALELSDRRYVPFVGKHIRRIRVKALAVFGAAVDDTARVAGSRALRFLNHLNFQTRETTIRQNLLFEEGDALDPLRLADSERILRNLAFIGDARIMVRPSHMPGDSVDVLVIVKEAWTLELSQSLKEGNSLRVRLSERNVLGLGHQISGSVTVVPDGSPRFDTKYVVQNIHGSFVTAELEYVKMPDREAAGLAFSRELISPVLRYAGGVELRRTSITVADSVPSAADNRSELVDVWTGRRVHLGLQQKGIDRRRFLFASARVRHLTFTRRPPVTPSTFYQYHGMVHVLGSLALIQSRYYQTNLLYDFGQTEDVPSGFVTRVTCGLADEEFSRIPYGSASLAAGGAIDRMGYGAGELRVGGYLKAKRFEQGVIRLRTLYFSNILNAGWLRLRQFFSAAYIAGIHRSADDSIDFGGDTGIRGVTYPGRVTGSKRLQLNAETVAFAPWKVRGVTFAFFTFADLDVIGSGQRSVLAQDYYSGLGLGVRLHKAAYGIAPIQLRFAWYPRLPMDHDAYSYTAFGEKRFRSIEFLGTRPEIVEY